MAIRENIHVEEARMLAVSVVALVNSCLRDLAPRIDLNLQRHREAGVQILRPAMHLRLRNKLNENVLVARHDTSLLTAAFALNATR